MSEPSRWGPPGFDAASSPTAPIPTAPRQAPRPGPPRPTAPYPTRQGPPAPHPADRDGYGDAYRDDRGGAYGEDHGAYGDDDRGERRRGRPPAGPRTRGQVFAGVVLVLALVVSALLGVLTYQVLAAVDLISADPFGSVAGQATTLAGVAFGALVVFVLAVIAIVVARPKVLAGIGLAASLLLPVGALALGLWYGGGVLRQNVESDVAAEGEAAARTVAAAAVDELERRGLDIGPLRDMVVGLAGGDG